jgi:hypothetical protein
MSSRKLIGLGHNRLPESVIYRMSEHSVTFRCQYCTLQFESDTGTGLGFSLGFSFSLSLFQFQVFPELYPDWYWNWI